MSSGSLYSQLAIGTIQCLHTMLIASLGNNLSIQSLKPFIHIFTSNHLSKHRMSKNFLQLSINTWTCQTVWIKYKGMRKRLNIRWVVPALTWTPRTQIALESCTLQVLSNNPPQLHWMNFQATIPVLSIITCQLYDLQLHPFIYT